MHELKQQRQWLCWGYRLKDGKLKKWPYEASSGRSSGSDEKHRTGWVTYDEAVAAKDRTGKYDGVGLALPEGFFMLDIDHRGIDDPLTRKLFSRFNSYTEVSPSGNGFHIIGTCDLRRIPTELAKDNNTGELKPKLDNAYYVKNDRLGIELYIGGLTNRYTTYTGKAVNDIPVQDCTEAILQTLEDTMRKAGRKKKAVPTSDKDRELTEDEITVIVCNARKAKNGEKFTRMFDKGEITDSPSEADISLCAMIAFWTGNNPTGVDQIFRRSKLYRDKWERDDYRNSTIAKAIEACQGVFHWSTIEQPPFVRIDAGHKKPRVLATLLADYIRATEDYILVQNDGGEGTLVFVYQDGFYRQYSRDMLLGMIKRPVEEYNRELVSMNQINEAYNQIRTDLKFIPQDKLNAEENLINFQNGLLRISPDALELLPHTETIYSTVQIPCLWTGRATPTPVFDRYINKLTGGDSGVINLLLEYIGAILSNVKGWRFKKALFLVGEGDTGKSVLKSLVERILGPDNYATLDLEQMEARFGTSRIYLKRLAGSSDMGFMAIPQLRILKQATGGDGLFAENKGQQGYSFVYNGFLWFCTNRLPKFGGDDGQWVYDRIMIVRCENVIPKDQQDKELLDKLYLEREGIVYKAIKALQNVIAAGYRFTEPSSVIAARQEYLKENNSVIGFYDDCLIYDPSLKPAETCTVKEMFEAYRNWCAANTNGHPKNRTDFRNTIAAHLGYSYGKLKGDNQRGPIFKGLTLTGEAKQDWLPLGRYY